MNYRTAMISTKSAVVFFALGLAGNAAAQQDAGALDEIEEIIVTGVARDATKLDSSVSVSTMSVDDISDFSPTNTAEIFRNLPGVRAEGSGGEGGNAQIAVRGLPVAAGGAKFLILQEDGLPVLQFGDIAFGTSDSFVRHDYTIDRIESIRGGSASTLASNSPGGIINVISKTGEQQGGSFGLTAGLDFDHFRTDFEYGGPIGDDMRFHVGGFYRNGEGPRDAGYTGNKGFQLKANITKEFESGFVRLYLKRLDDRSITYLPMPMAANGGSLPGFDSLNDTPHSAYLVADQGLGGDNQFTRTNITDGVNPEQTRIGVEFAFDLAADWAISNRFATSELTGGWASPFPSEVGAAQAVADTTVGLIPSGDTSGPATLVYANGPNAGSAFDMANANGNGLVMRTHLFNTKINDFGSFANDFRLSKSFENADLTIGLYAASQDINMTWQWNSYLMEVKGSNAALLDVVDASGAQLSQNGLYAYGVPFWGNCCQRNYDSTYDILAPYADLQLNLDRWSINLSVRQDDGKARGHYAGSAQSTVDVNSDGVISPNEESVSGIDNVNRSPVNYDWDYTSYSVGVNFGLTDSRSIFGRFSHGGRANADRLLFGTVQADGSIRSQQAIDEVDQLEFGYKHEADDYRLYATLFYAETQEQNFELTSQRFFDREYEAIGIEFEGDVDWDAFNLRGTLTWTDAEIASDEITPANEGNTPRRQPDLIYALTPSYVGERFRVGANIIGATKAFAQDNNDLEFDAFTQVNAFFYYDFTDRLGLSLRVNNVFDEVALTEAEEGSISTISAPGTSADGLQVIRGRTYAGRSTLLTLKYSFE